MRNSIKMIRLHDVCKGYKNSDNTQIILDAVKRAGFVAPYQPGGRGGVHWIPEEDEPAVAKAWENRPRYKPVIKQPTQTTIIEPSEKKVLDSLSELLVDFSDAVNKLKEPSC